MIRTFVRQKSQKTRKQNPQFVEFFIENIVVKQSFSRTMSGTEEKEKKNT